MRQLINNVKRTGQKRKMCVEKMLSQLTGDMYEFYQWLKSKCSGVVGVDITYGKTHRDGSEDVCMTFQLQYHWENEMNKRKDAGIHKIIAILEYIAKKFGWGVDIKWFNSYRVATDDVLMIKLINRKENLTTEVKSKMKKLNITKEQFEKSKYFKNKYGKLEFVSESGKLFKTNKGKVLKFKESVGDVANDPAYVCPYCGSRNCEFVDADDYPEEGYFDGATLLSEFMCNDCEKSYGVSFKLNVDDVIAAPPMGLNINR